MRVFHEVLLDCRGLLYGEGIPLYNSGNGSVPIKPEKRRPGGFS
jgi:hypothetical protein